MKIDEDIKLKVDHMNPSSLGQRAAMEITLQERRNLQVYRELENEKRLLEKIMRVEPDPDDPPLITL